MSTTTNICPKCGSGKVSIQMMDSDDARAECMNCGWVGTRKDAISVELPENPFSLDVDPDRALEIAKQISSEFMHRLYQHVSQPIGLALIESGMVGRKDTQSLTRLLRAACLGAHKAALEEAEAIGEEHRQMAVLSKNSS